MISQIFIVLTISIYIYWVKQKRRIIGENYLTRYFIIPKNRWFNIYLHRYTGSDDDRALHDHPWRSMSILLKGDLIEIIEQGTHDGKNFFHLCRAIERFEPFYRDAEYKHRIVLKSDVAWTLFFTGSVVREWGFHCHNGWGHWSDFTDESGNGVGKGCD